MKNPLEFFQDLIDRYGLLSILSFLLGTVLIILGATSGIKIGNFDLLVSNQNQILTFISGLISITFSFYQFRISELKSRPNVKNLGIEIKHPLPNARTQITLFHGTLKCKKLPNGYKLRAIRVWGKDEKDPFFPVWFEINVDLKAKTWRTTKEIDIGGEKGDVRVLKICLVDADTDALLEYYLNAYRVHEAASNALISSLQSQNKPLLPNLYLPGFTHRPSGLLVCDEVELLRS